MTHKLEKVLIERNKEKLDQSATSLLSSIFKEIKKRKEWVETRQEQIKELGLLSEKLYAAYDIGDIDQVETISAEFSELTHRGCKKRIVVHPSRRSSGWNLGDYDDNFLEQ